MTKSVDRIMSKKLVTVGLDDSIRKAYEVMQERKIRHLPVVDQAGGIVGILSDRDVRRAMIPKSGTDLSAWDESSIEFDPEHRVYDFMSWPVHEVSEHISVEEVASKMLKEKLSAVLVTSGDGRMSRGIVTTDDLLRLLVSLLSEKPRGKIIKLGEIPEILFAEN